MKLLRAVLGVVVLLMLVAAPEVSRRPVVVAAEDDLQAALDAAPSGSTVVLGPGEHRGPVRIARPVAVVGEPGARVVAPAEADAALEITAKGASLSHVQVRGGWTGIEVDDAAGATVTDVLVRDSIAQGIRVYKAPAVLAGVTVTDLSDPHAQGIEVLSAPDVVVRDSHVVGGKVGIVAHLSEVTFEDNRVEGTREAGVMIREMSTGRARGNVIAEASGAGLYCGDMSFCEFSSNRATAISDSGMGRSGAGWGLVAHYESRASSRGDELSGEAGGRVALAGSRFSERSPLDPEGDLAALVRTAAATALLIVLLIAGTSAVRRRGGLGGVVADANATFIATRLLIVGLAVQSFHMLEHVVQLSRVQLDRVPSRGSLVGSVVDTEWVHFVYNALVLAGMVTIVVLRRRGWAPRGNAVLGDGLLVSATALQGWHVIEHVARVTQHVITGAKVNPGLLGQHLDLVMLHFALNAAIYLGFIAAVAAYWWRRRPIAALDAATAEAT